jgi:hypothetical protein
VRSSGGRKNLGGFMITKVLFLVVVVLLINKYCYNVFLHIGYGFMLKRENKKRQAMGLKDLPYNLPFEKDEGKEE